MNNGIIYKITNKVNNMIYIGKTKKYYGNTKFGINGRLNKHLYDALSNSKKKNDCPKLYNAIRKYGKDNFCIEALEFCDLKNYNEKEKYYVAKYESYKRHIGYNIALGGGGRSVVDTKESTREKISKSQRSNNMMNIKPYYRNNNMVGYVARRKKNGHQYSKFFTSTKYTLEQNLEMAKKYISDLKSNNTPTNKYNRNDNLPLNITKCYSKSNKKHVGYTFHKMINRVKYSKSFQDKSKLLTELLNAAIQYKKTIMNKVITT